MPESPEQTRVWSRGFEKKSLVWTHGLFGALSIGSDKELGDVVGNGPNACSHLYLFSRPSSLRFEINVRAEDGVRILHAKAGEVTDVTVDSVPEFEVPINWDHSAGIPHTRVKDMDNLDVVFLAKGGEFVQLQVSLVTRKKRFWVCVQEIYSGQVVRTTLAKAQELDVTSHKVGAHAGLIVPLYAENAYPGADYLKSNPRMGPTVIERAIGWGAVVPMSECVVAEWKPEQFELPEAMAKVGYVKAVVTWFNLVIGYGFVTLESGQSVYVHFNDVVDEKGQRIAEEGECPMLQAMRGVAIKYQSGPKPKATAIRIF